MKHEIYVARPMGGAEAHPIFLSTQRMPDLASPKPHGPKNALDRL